MCRGEGVEWGVGQAPVSLTQPACVYVGVPARPLTSGELKFPHSKMCGLSCVYKFPEFRGALGGVASRGGEAARERSLFWEAGEDAAGLSLVLELFACEWVRGCFFFVSGLAGRVLAAARSRCSVHFPLSQGETVQ